MTLVFFYASCKEYDYLGFSLEKREAIAKEYMNNINEGVVVVRIPWFESKINRLQELIKSNKSDSFKKRAKNEIAKTKLERTQFYNLIIKEMNDNFTYSDFVFVKDTDYKALLNGARKGIFSDRNGIYNPNLSITEKFVTLYIDMEITEKTLVFVDKEDVVLQSPFPQIPSRKRKAPNIREIFRMLKGEDVTLVRYKKNIIDLNKKLELY